MSKYGSYDPNIAQNSKKYRKFKKMSHISNFENGPKIIFCISKNPKIRFFQIHRFLYKIPHFYPLWGDIDIDFLRKSPKLGPFLAVPSNVPCMRDLPSFHLEYCTAGGNCGKERAGAERQHRDKSWPRPMEMRYNNPPRGDRSAGF